jgi:ApbE superfamily uncharacterized protein (UPF0280 family)
MAVDLFCLFIIGIIVVQHEEVGLPKGIPELVAVRNRMGIVPIQPKVRGYTQA